jgi:cyclophilin family peptidyl-prolyl cis-trans isomerase
LVSGTTRTEQFWAERRGQEAWDAEHPLVRLLLVGMLTQEDMPVDTVGLDPDALYLVTASGGVDRDPASGRAISDSPENVQGNWHAIATGQRILDGNIQVSALSEAIYQQVRSRLDQLSDEAVIEQLEAAARLLVTDTDKSGTVDYNDVLDFSRSLDADRFRGDIATLDALAEAVRAGQPQASLESLAADAFGSHRVVLTTNFGNMVLETLNWEAPVSVDNFLRYVEAGLYTRVVFHRVIEDFVIQGGFWQLNEAETSLSPIFRDTPPYGPIRNEARYSVSNSRGTVAFARTSDPDSATSQFYINHTDNTDLDFGFNGGAGYAVFARLTTGLGVLDEIAALPTGFLSGVGSDFPAEIVLIESASVED